MSDLIKLKWIEEDLKKQRHPFWIKELHYAYFDNGKDDLILGSIAKEIIFLSSLEESIVYRWNVKGDSKLFEDSCLELAKFKVWLKLSYLYKEKKIVLFN